MTAPTAPIVIEANQPERFYRGGPAIAAFRGLASPGNRFPEDWVASATALFGQEELGLSRLPSGELLRDAIRADPQGWLGAEHVERFGADPALLVKLLDAGQRLPVHAHPSREFAARHLSCPFGKTEAWIILATHGEAGTVHLGFRRAVDEQTLAGWVRDQETDAMLAALHAVPVREGDAVLVPAGLPHAIGEGVLLVELQEPTDFSVLMQWEGFAVDGPSEGHLGVGYDLALSCVDRRGLAPQELDELRSSLSGLGDGQGGGAVQAGGGVEHPLPGAAEPFFRAERVRLGGLAGSVQLDAGFSILVVVAGQGRLTSGSTSATTSGAQPAPTPGAQPAPTPGVQPGSTPGTKPALASGAQPAPVSVGEPGLDLRRGMTVLVPYAAGPLELRGDLHAIRCRPPHPA